MCGSTFQQVSTGFLQLSELFEADAANRAERGFAFRSPPNPRGETWILVPTLACVDIAETEVWVKAKGSGRALGGWWEGKLLRKRQRFKELDQTPKNRRIQNQDKTQEREQSEGLLGSSAKAFNDTKPGKDQSDETGLCSEIN